MTLHIPNIDSLPQVADEFIKAAPGPVIAFHGAMGAGKTTFVAALCEALQVEDVVNSPTFAIVNEYYSARLDDAVYHFDFYRIKNIDEAINIGTTDYFSSGRLCLVEWPELIEPLLPDNCTHVNITVLPDGSRELTF